MKNKILALIAKPLDALYEFRIERLFILPKEARKMLDNQARKLHDDLAEKKMRFQHAADQLVSARLGGFHNGYEIKLHVNRAIFETEAGENAAVAQLALHLAQAIVGRHNKSKQAEKERADRVKKLHTKATSEK